MQQTDLLNGNEQFIGSRVLNVQKIFALTVKIQSFDAEIFADTVFDVDDVIAGLNVGERTNFFARIREFACPTTTRDTAEKIFLREDDKFCSRHRKAVAQVAEFKINARQMIFRQKFFHAEKF